MNDKLEDLVSALADSLPKGLHETKADLEKNFRSVLSRYFAKLDLVTREEFDVQRQVLRRTREKLEKLEATLAELEQQK